MLSLYLVTAFSGTMKMMDRGKVVTTTDASFLRPAFRPHTANIFPSLLSKS